MRRVENRLFFLCHKLIGGAVVSKRECEVMVLAALTGYKVREVANMLGATERHGLRAQEQRIEKAPQVSGEAGY